MYTHIMLFLSLVIIPATAQAMAPAIKSSPEDDGSEELAAILRNQEEKEEEQDPIARDQTPAPAQWEYHAPLNFYSTPVYLIPGERLISTSRNSRSKKARNLLLDLEKFGISARGLRA